MKTPSNRLFVISVIIIITLLGLFLISLSQNETDWYDNSIQCSGIVTDSKLITKHNTIGRARKGDIFTKYYKCIQTIQNDSFIGTIVTELNDSLGDEMSLHHWCEEKIGQKVQGYCNDNEMRKYRISHDGVIGIVFLLCIIIFAGKLIYNHHQRKKIISK